jgi:hypothetical protein
MRRTLYVLMAGLLIANSGPTAGITCRQREGEKKCGRGLATPCRRGTLTGARVQRTAT